MLGQTYTTGDIAVMLLVSPRTVRKWIDSGLLQGRRTAGGKHRRVAHTDLLGFLEAHWPGWRAGLRHEYTTSLSGWSAVWWRGVVRGWLQHRPCLGAWLALLGCEQDFAEPDVTPGRGRM